MSLLFTQLMKYILLRQSIISSSSSYVRQVICHPKLKQYLTFDKNVLRKFSNESSFGQSKSKQNHRSKSIGLEVWEIPYTSGGADRDDEETGKRKLCYKVKINKDDMSFNQQQIWQVANNTPTTKSVPSNLESETAKITNKVYKFMLHSFLPTDYPHSVDKCYKEFASYCFLGSICGSAAMVLSTQTLLIAVGVGSASAAPVAGALNWVLKDGIGQLGGVLFAAKITSNSSGNTIDSDPKRWRMVSAISMDGATLLEILSPLAPGYFLLVASVANIGKNIAFLTAGASRAALHQALAFKDNLGDVTAKAGSQSIAASLLGTSLGIGLSPLIVEDYFHITLGFIGLSSIHQFCTYKSLKAVALKKLNRHRLLIALNLFVNQLSNDKVMIEDDNQNVLSPASVSKHETFIPFFHPDDSHTWLHIGSPLIEIASTPDIIHRLINECLSEEKYILNCDLDFTCNYPIKIKKVMLTFHHDATDADIIRGMFHAKAIHLFAVKNRSIILDQNIDTAKKNNDELKFHAISASYHYMIKYIDHLINHLEMWWDVKGNSIHVECSSSIRLKMNKNV